jgi:phage gp29-like protein
MSIREKIGAAAAWFADLAGGVKGEKRAEGETGVAFIEAAWAKFGIKPYRADDLLKSKALRLVVYREMMRDPVVKAALRNRVYSVMTADWDVRPAGLDRRSKPDPADPRVQAADFIRACVATPKGRWPKLLFDLSQALVDGFAVVEKVYAQIEDGPWAGKIGLAALKAKDVDTWDFDCDEYMNVTGLKQQVWGVWEERDRAKFIVFSWLPQFENPLGQSEFRAAYRAFWLKDMAFKFRAIYLETIAKGKQKVTYQADQGADGLKKAQKLLDVMQNSIGMAIPSDLAVEIVEYAVAPEQAFEAFQARCDREIVVGLQGAVLQMLEGENTGALRATETHRRTAEPWTAVFAAFVEAAIQDDLVADLVGKNFAGVEAPEVYFHWDREDQDQHSQVLERLQKMGLKIPAWFLYEQFNVPQPEPEDEVLEAPKPLSPFVTAGTGNREQGTGKTPGMPGDNAAVDAAALADSPIPGDPRDELIARAAAKAGPAYASLFDTLKKKALRI